MKIVNIIATCASGGAEVLVKDTLITLSKNTNLELELWVMSKVEDSVLQTTESSLNFEKDYINELETNGVKVRVLEKKANKDKLKTWLKIRKLYKEVKPDIIHTHLESVTLNTAIALIGTSARQIQTIHSIKIFYPKIQRYFLDKVLKKNISISPEVTSEMKRINMNLNKIKLIQNGINLDKYKFDERKIENVKNYIAIGRLGEEKNHEMLISAFSKFINSTNNLDKEIKLRIIGDGIEKEKLQKLIKRLKMENKIELLGVQKNIPKFLRSSDIYVMSSKWEGLSISLIEAAANGLPLIATNVGSNSLICKNGINGWIFESGDEERLVSIFKESQEISKNKLMEFSKKSAEISKEYDLKKISKQLIDLYIQCK